MAQAHIVNHLRWASPTRLLGLLTAGGLRVYCADFGAAETGYDQADRRGRLGRSGGARPSTAGAVRGAGPRARHEGRGGAPGPVVRAPRSPTRARCLSRSPSCAATIAATAPSPTAPAPGEKAYLTPDEVLEIARAGAEAGCKEALFTLGDKPEKRYPEARRELRELGFATTIEYLAHCCRLVLEETGLLPHANPGVLSEDEVRALRRGVGLAGDHARAGLGPAARPEPGALGLAGQGAGQEARDHRRGRQAAGPVHHGGPDRDRRDHRGAGGHPARHPGRARRHGHIQECIVQNFRAKPGTRMALLARALRGRDARDHRPRQAPPAPRRDGPGPAEPRRAGRPTADPSYARYIDAGIRRLGRRLPRHPGPREPRAALAAPRGAGERQPRRGATCSSNGWPSTPPTPATPRRGWTSGCGPACGPPRTPRASRGSRTGRQGLRRRSPRRRSPRRAGCAHRRCGPSSRGRSRRRGAGISTRRRSPCSSRRGGRSSPSFAGSPTSCRREVNGDEITYVVNRNINYTNQCYFRCRFCAFSKGPKSLNLRGDPYLLDTAEVARRAREAWEKGATEVCMVGRHPRPASPGKNYLEYLRAVKEEVPEMHVHAFTPLEVSQGAHTLGLSVEEFLRRAQGGGPRDAAWDGGGDPGRRDPRHHLPRQDQHRRSGPT